MPVKQNNSLEYVEFYITNHCNFDCDGCNRFNNYNFRGHQRWKDHAETYKAWSKRLDINKIGILGGEPMMNPDYMDWITGVHELWPNSKILFYTNGSLINPNNRDFYNLALQLKDNLTVAVALHNSDRLTPMIDTLQAWMIGPVDLSTDSPRNVDFGNHSEDVFKQSYQQIKDPLWPEINSVDDWDNLPIDVQKECQEIHGLDPKKFASTELINESQKSIILTDKNNVKVNIKKQDYFSQSALIHNKEHQSIRLHNSDPIKAHDTCGMKVCHQFDKGKLYKCGVAALLPEFYQQFDMDVTAEQVEIIHSYMPGSIDFSDLELQKFVQDINKPINQCQFCPEDFNFKVINSQVQKVHFKRKKLSN
jgi:organic radical activating enzyme